MNNRLLIINGPGLSDLSNYNETGYDDLTLDAVQQKCSETCEGLGLEMDFRQKDNESELLSVLIEDIDNFVPSDDLVMQRKERRQLLLKRILLPIEKDLEK